MDNDFSNKFLLTSLGIPIIENILEFSYATGISDKQIYLLSNYNNKYYKTFLILKKNHKKRKIEAPNKPMKIMQKWILENILLYIPITPCAYGFIKELRSPTKKNAEIHKESQYLLQMDVENFFPSINEIQVYSIFRKIGYNSRISKTLTNICTVHGHLPQGGVTSPYLSNLACFRLDKRISGLCAKRDIHYTRYADDLTFSCDNKNNLRRIQKIIEEILSDEGFNVNHNKTRFSYHSKRITGLNVVDRKVLVPRKIKRKLRALIHSTFVLGEFEKNRDMINGYLSYIESIEPGYTKKIMKYIATLKGKDYKYFEEIVSNYNDFGLNYNEEKWEYDSLYDIESIESEIIPKEHMLLKKHIGKFSELFKNYSDFRKNHDGYNPEVDEFIDELSECDKQIYSELSDVFEYFRVKEKIQINHQKYLDKVTK